MGPAVLRHASRNVARSDGCLHLDGLWVATLADVVAACSCAMSCTSCPPLPRAMGPPHAQDLVFGSLREPDVQAAGSTSTSAARSARSARSAERSTPASGAYLTEDMPIAPKSDEPWRILAQGRFGAKERRSPSAVLRAEWTRPDGSRPGLLLAGGISARSNESEVGKEAIGDLGDVFPTEYERLLYQRLSGCSST